MSWWVLLLGVAFLVLAVLAFVALARSQGSESTLVVDGAELRVPDDDPTDLPGPGAEESVPEPDDRPEGRAQWDEVHGRWIVWDETAGAWVPDPAPPEGT